MNNQPYAVSFDDTKKTDAVNRARNSGRREAEAMERSQQILDYYRGNKSRKDGRA